MKRLIVFSLLIFTFAAYVLAQSKTNDLQTQELRHTREMLEQKIKSQNKEIAHQREVMVFSKISNVNHYNTKRL